MPSSYSDSHFGSLISGVSMSAILIFTPSNQNVSPSTTQVVEAVMACETSKTEERRLLNRRAYLAYYGCG